MESVLNLIGNTPLLKLTSFQVNQSEEDILPVLKEGKVAIIMDKDIFLGFITKVDIINRYRTQIYI